MIPLPSPPLTSFRLDSNESGARWDVFCAMPAKPGSILDIGCGFGKGFEPYHKQGVEVIGIDNDPQLRQQSMECLDGLYILDVEKDPFPEELLNRFDVVAFCDSLEHMVDPWAVLQKAKLLLKDGGVVVASIPNV